jgi:hypothetical protein
MDSITAKRYDDYWKKAGIGSNETWNGFKKYNPNGTLDDYFAQVKSEYPWPAGYVPKSITLKSGDTFNMALDSSQPITSPGRFATTNNISDINFVRENLAVKANWKTDPTVVVTYRVKDGVEIPALTGPVGPQVDMGANRYLPGGADQTQILLGREVNMMDYLEIKNVKYIE